MEEEKELIARIEKQLQNRPKNLYVSDSAKSFFSVIKVFLILSIGYEVILRIYNRNFPELSNYQIITYSSLIIGLTAFLISLDIKTKEPPKDKSMIDKWLWINGKRLFIARLFYTFFGSIFLAMNFNSNPTQSQNQELMIGVLVGICLYSLIVFIIILNPILLTKNWLTKLGSILLIGSGGLTTIFITLNLNTNRLGVLICFIGFFFLFRLLKYITKKDNLDLVQITAINVINPIKLLDLLQEKSQIK